MKNPLSMSSAISPQKQIQFLQQPLPLKKEKSETYSTQPSYTLIQKRVPDLKVKTQHQQPALKATEDINEFTFKNRKGCEFGKTGVFGSLGMNNKEEQTQAQ